MPDNEYLEADDAGWKKGEFAPVREHCKSCGELMPRTHKREAFGGRGRPREFCDAVCRKRASRRKLREAEAARRRAEWEARNLEAAARIKAEWAKRAKAAKPKAKGKSKR